MSEMEPALQSAEQMLQPWAVAVTRPEANRVDVILRREDILAAIEALLEAKWGFLSTITGIDRPAPALAEGQPQAAGELEVLYSFCAGAVVLSLRVRVPYTDPVLPTICNLIPSATLGERELMEMFGFVVQGTPDTSRLILADIWPEGVYPLRKSFVPNPAPANESQGG
ncbi:MAG: NADH-quinone oxidoreductase subunit C [Chloroflexota bacterium]|jgi:Ni,Fe-hydrogenase III component G